MFLPEQMRLRNSFALEGHATIATLLRMIPSLKSLKNLDGGLFLYMSFRSTDIDSTRSSQSSRGQIGPLSDDIFEMWVMTLSQLCQNLDNLKKIGEKSHFHKCVDKFS